MKNPLVVQILENIADLLSLQDDRFRTRAYRNAARTVENLDKPIEEVENLTSLPGIGIHIADKIDEIIRTGKLQYYEKLKKQIKVDIESLKKIPFLGPKKIKILYEKLKIKTIKDLENAIKKKKLQKLKGFGEKTEQTLLEGIEHFKTKPKRTLYNKAEPIVKKMHTYLSKNEHVKQLEVAGSFRRQKATIGDLDFLVVSTKPKEVIAHFIKFPNTKKILNKGTTKASIRLKTGLQIDLRVVKKKEFGAALLYFTGDKNHNVALRKRALKKGMTLNEYALTKKDGTWVAGKTEQGIYKALGLKFIPPQKRLNHGEIEAARK